MYLHTFVPISFWSIPQDHTHTVMCREGSNRGWLVSGNIGLFSYGLHC